MTTRLAILLVAAALSGCSHYAVHSTTAAAPSPTTSGLFVNVSIELSATAANIINGLMFAGFLVAANSVMGEPPQMKEDRTINEQDCTRPIVDLTVNLMCK